MENNLLSSMTEALTAREESRIAQSNGKTERFGLRLTREQAHELVEYHNESLKRYRLVEFDESIFDKLIFTFCDSDYIEQDSYLDTLEALQDIFYNIRSESDVSVTDDTILEMMKERFELTGGDLDYMMDMDEDQAEYIRRQNQELYDSEMSRLSDD